MPGHEKMSPGEINLVEVTSAAAKATKANLLVVDDDRELCRLISEFLEEDGFRPSAVHTGADGVEQAIHGSYQIIILDVMLPDMKGFDVLRAIRLQNRTPVLMLTAKGDEYDRIFGLELGADDYLAKPFSPRELAARLSAILRRSGWQQEGGALVRPAIVRSGDLEFDMASRTVKRDNEELKLTSAEFDLLRIFLESMGKILTRDVLMEAVLDRKFTPFDRSIDLHISNLRRKLGKYENGSERIRSIRGMGYLYVWPSA